MFLSNIVGKAYKNEICSTHFEYGFFTNRNTLKHYKLRKNALWKYKSCIIVWAGNECYFSDCEV